MRQIIKDTFFDFTVKREGFTPFMYADILNLVTTGVGNLIDAGPNHNPGGNSPSVIRARLNNVVSPAAMAPALRLPWKFKGPGWSKTNPVALEGIVSQSTIADAWTTVKRQNEVVPDFSQRGGFAYQDLTPLTLDMDGMRTLFASTLASFDKTLASRYTQYETAPADAQLAILSMSWAMGPAFNFPQFKTAFEARDWAKAGELSFFKGGGGTPEKRTGRNADNVIMFNNAAVVEVTGADPDRLIFPGTGGSGKPGVILPSTGIVDSGTAAKVALGTGAAVVGGWGLYKLWESWKK